MMLAFVERASVGMFERHHARLKRNTQKRAEGPQGSERIANEVFIVELVNGKATGDQAVPLLFELTASEQGAEQHSAFGEVWFVLGGGDDAAADSEGVA